MDKWINKFWYIHTIDCYSAIKNTILIHTTAWMNLESIMLSERKDKKAHILYDLFYMVYLEKLNP